MDMIAGACGGPLKFDPFPRDYGILMGHLLSVGAQKTVRSDHHSLHRTKRHGGTKQKVDTKESLITSTTMRTQVQNTRNSTGHPSALTWRVLPRVCSMEFRLPLSPHRQSQESCIQENACVKNKMNSSYWCVFEQKIITDNALGIVLITFRF